jgi:hypothetical protein
MSTHTSTSGFTFTIREPADVPERLRRPVAAKLMQIGKTGDAAKRAADLDKLRLVADGFAAADIADDLTAGFDLTDADDLNDLLAVALLSAWSLVDPTSLAQVPIGLEALRDLSQRDYSAIRTAVAPFITQMLPDFSPSPDPESPSSP